MTWHCFSHLGFIFKSFRIWRVVYWNDTIMDIYSIHGKWKKLLWLIDLKGMIINLVAWNHNKSMKAWWLFPFTHYILLLHIWNEDAWRNWILECSIVRVQKCEIFESFSFLFFFIWSYQWHLGLLHFGMFVDIIMINYKFQESWQLICLCQTIDFTQEAILGTTNGSNARILDLGYFVCWWNIWSLDAWTRTP